MGVFVPITVRGSFGAAIPILFVALVFMILILGASPNSASARAVASLFLVGAMAYFPSA